MKARFEVVFLEEAIAFMECLHHADRMKIIFNIDKARFIQDPRLFKKVTEELWEFRTRYRGNQYRLLAFWDKRNTRDTLVLATHGLVKKSDRLPRKELEKAMRIRMAYLKE